MNIVVVHFFIVPFHDKTRKCWNKPPLCLQGHVFTVVVMMTMMVMMMVMTTIEIPLAVMFSDDIEDGVGDNDDDGTK